MPEKRYETIHTRASLIGRIKNPESQTAWQEFYDIYGKLIYWAALKAGLTEDEAQEVVQETLITVVKKIKDFQYDRARGSFKSWLLHTTHWRIQDQFRKRKPAAHHSDPHPEDPQRTATIARVPDPSLDLDRHWEEQWQKNLVETALQRIKSQVNPKHWQIFDSHVNKAWPVAKVASTFKITEEQVYVIKSRVGGLLKKEVRSLEANLV